MRKVFFVDPAIPLAEIKKIFPTSIFYSSVEIELFAKKSTAHYQAKLPKNQATLTKKQQRSSSTPASTQFLDSNSLAIYIGFCSSKEEDREAFVINKIRTKKKNLIPELFLDVSQRSVESIFLDKRLDLENRKLNKSIEKNFLEKIKENYWDYESADIFKILSENFSLERMLLIKVPIFYLNQDISKEELIFAKEKLRVLNMIQSFTDLAKKEFTQESFFSKKEKLIIEEIFDLAYFTVTMRKELLEKLYFLKQEGGSLEDFFRKVKKKSASNKKDLAKQILLLGKV